MKTSTLIVVGAAALIVFARRGTASSQGDAPPVLVAPQPTVSPTSRPILTPPTPVTTGAGFATSGAVPSNWSATDFANYVLKKFPGVQFVYIPAYRGYGYSQEPAWRSASPIPLARATGGWDDNILSIGQAVG